MVQFNLTHEHLTETLPGVKEIYDLHKSVTKTNDAIFKDSSINSYSQSAKAADVLQIAQSQVNEMFTKLETEAFNEVKSLEEAYYGTDVKKIKPFKHLQDLEAWMNFLLETDEDKATEVLQNDLIVRKSALQYLSLYGKESAPEAHELLLRSFENQNELIIAESKAMEQTIPALKESFSSSLQEQFKLEGKHDYESSAQILAGRV